MCGWWALSASVADDACNHSDSMFGFQLRRRFRASDWLDRTTCKIIVAAGIFVSLPYQNLFVWFDGYLENGVEVVEVEFVGFGLLVCLFLFLAEPLTRCMKFRSEVY
jgi:hypothetical protein